MRFVNGTGAVGARAASCRSCRGVVAGISMLLAAMAALLAALVFCGALFPSAAYAADKDYTYTVRVFSGNQGTVDGGDCKVYSNIAAGSRWSFQPEMVSVTDSSKYYVKGIRVAGRDNDTVNLVNNTSSFIVNEDVDLVVAYGMKGSLTHYTVTYVDENGRELAPAQRYEGNVGDRPVVAYRYVDGYRPQAYNLTGTLSEDESSNAFTFVYSLIATGEDEEGTTGGNGTGAPTGGTTGGAGGAATGGAAGGATGAAGEGTAGQEDQDGTVEENPTPTTDIPVDGVPLADAPDEIDSIDENEVPLAANANGGSQVLWGLASPIGIAVALLALVVIGIVVWRFVVMRKRSRSMSHER